MTGHQQSPTTDIALDGTRLRPVDIRGLLKSIGISYIRTINPFNIKSSIVTIKDAIRARKGVRVIISEQECALQYGRRLAKGERETEVYYQIDPGRCQKCNECYVELGCPAIRKEVTDGDFSYYIEEAACLMCGACHDLCLNSAILRTEVRRVARTGDRA
jgi:indolepyruvate ferredoxin oxidoreductase alpha subunit